MSNLADNYKKEVDYLDKAVSAKEKDDTTSEMPEDLAPFGKIIEALVNSGINIFECTQLSDKEKENFEELGGIFLEREINGRKSPQFLMK